MAVCRRHHNSIARWLSLKFYIGRELAVPFSWRQNNTAQVTISE